MSDDERVLRSFVADDEEWLECWSLTAVKRSVGQLPPKSGTETVALTDERVLWFDDELEDVWLAAVEETDREYVERQSAPPMVLGGGLLFVLGVFITLGAFFASAGDAFVIAMPAMTGLAAFLATWVVANVTDREGETWAGHRVRLWLAEGPVSIWGDDEATMADLQATVEDVMAADDGVESQAQSEGEAREGDEPEVAEEVANDDPTDEQDVAATDES
jgi:hypothetical protein